MPQVTVVIPTYHHHEYLEQCLGSILLNDFPSNIIIIPVLDDYPTLEKLQSIKFWNPLLHDRIKIIKSHGADPIRQMQLGLMATETKYVTFFGSDDFMLPSKLRLQVSTALMVEEKYPNHVPIINPNLIIANEDLSFSDIPKVKRFKLKNMLRGCILTESALTTTEALKSIGGFYDPDGTDWGYLNVYAMWLRLLSRKNCYVHMMTTPLALYRQLPTSRHKTRYKTKADMVAHKHRLLDVSDHYYPSKGV